MASIYCAGNYALFTDEGCIRYPATLGDTTVDMFSKPEGEIFERLTDVYNQLDHPQTTPSSPGEGTDEKMILDLVFDDEQI